MYIGCSVINDGLFYFFWDIFILNCVFCDFINFFFLNCVLIFGECFVYCLDLEYLFFSKNDLYVI